MSPTGGFPCLEKFFSPRFKNGCIFLKNFFSILWPQPVFLVLEKQELGFKKKTLFPKNGNSVFDPLTIFSDR
jgi:hypothetical protein